METGKGYIGITCAYSPLPIIDAAGFTPYRILPVGDWPDQAGRILHDNLCPHIKRVLDRAMENDLPELKGMIFMNSCDAMRRLADAWKKVRPEDNTLLVDLPVNLNEINKKYFGRELKILAETLTKWGGSTVTDDTLEKSMKSYNELADLIKKIHSGISEKTINGGSERMQSIYNKAMTEPLESTMTSLKTILNKREEADKQNSNVPVFLFGNVLSDTEAFKLFTSCGADIISDDLCTGSRMFTPVNISGKDDIYNELAQGLLSKPECARTIDNSNPGKLAENILSKAKESGAKGVIGNTVKFCDPYLDRVPIIRETLKEAGMPFLFLEGDCTMRSMGQQRTRIEAFIEMLR